MSQNALIAQIYATTKTLIEDIAKSNSLFLRSYKLAGVELAMQVYVVGALPLDQLHALEKHQYACFCLFHLRNQVVNKIFLNAQLTRLPIDKATNFYV